MPRAIVNIEPTTARDLHARGTVVLLDVREDSEWEAGHVSGAVHVPLSQLVPDRFAGADVVAICRSGNRSGKAAQILADAGVSVRNVNGGMRAWEDLGLPTITPSGQPGTVV